MLTFLIARLSSSLPCTRRTHLGGSFRHNASRIFSSFYSLLSLSDSNQPKQKLEGNESFTISYLINSLGFSAKVATQVSKRVNLKNLDNPNSVLNLFRSYGFSDTHISEIVKKHPEVLVVKSEKTLLPKLRFLHSIGFSCSELAELLICSKLLKWSLEKSIIPRYELLKSVLNDHEKVQIALKRSCWFHQDGANLLPNIKVLREIGVPQTSVTVLVTKFPGVAFLKHAKFVQYVKFAKDTGIEPFRFTFIQAIYVSAMTKKSTWELKLDCFERCGWSRDVTLSVFCKYPNCMTLSEEKITSTMKYLVDEMGLQSEDIARYPSLLGFSLKKRVIPRFFVLQNLKRNGLVKKNVSPFTIFSLTEKKFLKRYVIRYLEQAPQLFNIYKGHMPPLPKVQ